MAVSINIKIENLEHIREQYREAPAIVEKWLNRAIKAGVIEVDKRTDDSGNSGLFQFQTPRAERTGYLALSFAFGKVFRNLYAETGPTAYYAKFVLRNNPFLQRIAKDTEPDFQKHVDEAVEEITKEMVS